MTDLRTHFIRHLRLFKNNQYKFLLKNSNCASGFTGSTCIQSESACYPNPCLNSGTCLVGANGTFMCMCPPKFFGANCEMRSSKKYYLNI